MRNEVSDKDEFLSLFFTFIQQDLLDESGGTDLDPILSHLAAFCHWSAKEKDVLRGSLGAFAKFLVDNFFLPLKASAVKTPQPTPAPSHCETAIGTLQRLSTLRRDCLRRDRHRCVITRKFDAQEAESRYEKDGRNLKDDDGKSLLPECDTIAYLEVAHIITHSLMSLTGIEADNTQAYSNQTVHRILKMFNPSAIDLINGVGADRPMNALTLTRDLHT
ncbi:hypothetical protein ABOM_000676 [Aspergillus bombycis]|uniref:HNH nuclease domain-containing protein n=1 Tax=Aspergillus bombycis TaxID=109264 RepID=A0A1F8AGD6_9EURO|nr:hypothetical protein ABOM_000676 [Aspergillus bombycis]OGM50804.1 hypothetical protein ABOM_000676 [Aspergillus bombycis]